MASNGKKRFNWTSARATAQFYIPALIVVIAVTLSILYAEQQKRQIYRESLTSQVSEQLGLLRTKLEGSLNQNIQLLQGLVAVLSTEKNITQERFTELASRVAENSQQLRNIAVAPDMVVQFVYPYERNKQFIGRNLNSTPERSEAIKRVMETGELAIVGPVALANGGQGLVVQYPIIQSSEGETKLWGLLSGVIDLEKLYADSGLTADLPIYISISKPATQTRPTQPVYGDINATADDPVRTDIELAPETWRMEAVPKGGWHQSAPDLWIFRLQMLAVAVMIIAPVLSVARLLRERQGNVAVLRQREDELRAISHRLEIALEASKIGVWEMDIASGQLIWDNRMKQLYGMDPKLDECDFGTWRASLHPEDADAAIRDFDYAIKNGTDYSTDFRICWPSGEIRHMRAFGTIYRDARFRKKIVGVNWNVTSDIKLQQALRDAKIQAEIHNRELEEARRHMEFNSLHDALTGLANRRYLDQYLADLNAMKGKFSILTLLHIDLDRFKDINDTLGHGAGDEILKHTADKLRENIRKGDFAARIGGDEFVVVCKEMTDEAGAAELARRLIEALNTPIIYNGHECRVGASIGIASRSQANQPAEQLLVNADIALYEAKRHGRNRVEYFTDTLRSATVNTKRTADDILRSLEQNDFVAYFQPQFDAKTLEINGVEALARWRHPEKGLVGPDTFLKIAEGLNVVQQIDAAMLDQALFQLARWNANDLAIPRVSVNISAQRLFDDTLEKHLRDLAIKPGSLSFELLESISFDDKDEAVTAGIERIKSYGIDIEIDDFGTGYASILSLLKLSPRRLKIDRQLTMPILKSEPQRRLITSIVDIGRSLGIEIVAEGVETMEHAEILRDLGCHTLQGYALARPMAAEDFLEFALRHEPRQNGQTTISSQARRGSARR